MDPQTPLQRPWTLMVYMAGDNGKIFDTQAGRIKLMAPMEEAGYQDLFEMGTVGTTDQCAVTCLFDTLDASYLVEVRKGKRFSDSLVQPLREVNMGDPNALPVTEGEMVDDFFPDLLDPDLSLDFVQPAEVPCERVVRHDENEEADGESALRPRGESESVHLRQAVTWTDCRTAQGGTPDAGMMPSRQAAAPQQGENRPGCIPLSLAPVTLPVGILGGPYAHTIRTFGGESPVSLMVTAGSFPPGLAMSLKGAITGTPRASGVFTFTVMATDSCRAGKQAAFRTIRLDIVDSPAAAEAFQPSVIKKQPLKVTVTPTPATFTFPSGKGIERQVSYRITAQPAQTAALTSPGATFSVAGSVIECVLRPMGRLHRSRTRRSAQRTGCD